MLKKINFNVFTYGYLLFLAVILIAFTPSQTRPRQLLIKRYPGYELMRSQTEQLFKEGWQIKDMEPYQANSSSVSDFIVIYEK